MSTPLLPDALWNLIQPLLPPATVRPKGGRPRLSDCACLTGIAWDQHEDMPEVKLILNGNTGWNSDAANLSAIIQPTEKNGSSGRTRIHLKTSIQGLTEHGRRFKDVEVPSSSR